MTEINRLFSKNDCFSYESDYEFNGIIQRYKEIFGPLAKVPSEYEQDGVLGFNDDFELVVVTNPSSYYSTLEFYSRYETFLKEKIREFPLVQVPEKNPMYETCSINGIDFLSRDLWELAEDEQVFDMPLAGICIDCEPWRNSLTNLSDFMFHMKRIESASLDYPIILSPDGIIIDGYHRICKAIMKGLETIKAVRLSVMPESLQTQAKE